MPDWFLNILKTLGIFGLGAAAMSGAAAWLARTLIGHQLLRDLEQFKSDLKRVAFEHNTTFARTHQDRATVIGQLYKRLSRMVGGFERLVAPASHLLGISEEQADIERREALKEVMETSRDFNFYFRDNRLYLDEPLCRIIDELVAELRDVLIEVYMPEWTDPKLQAEKIKAWRRVWEKVNKKVPRLKREIEKRMRLILGLQDD